MKLTLLITLLLLLLSVGTLSEAQEKAQDKAKGPKAFDTTFDSAHPEALFPKMTRRFRKVINIKKHKYEVKKEKFHVVIPDNYDGSEAFGLLVWVDPHDSGAPQKQFLPLLKKHKLIWIGFHNSGNSRILWYRMANALTAAHNGQKQYKIDKKRVYIGGVSGGGRTTSWLMLNYPDVFTGAIPIVGVDYFTNLPSLTQKRTLPVGIPVKPLPRYLNLSKRNMKIAILTGEHDYNQPMSIICYKNGYKKNGWKHVAYFEMPKLGHIFPPAEWLEKCILFLDDPVKNKPAEPTTTENWKNLEKNPYPNQQKW